MTAGLGRAAGSTLGADKTYDMAMWQRLLAAAKPHQVDWRWVRGHAGDPMNERADRLATAAREALTRRR